MSNRRFLSNTFMVAMIRQLAGTRIMSVFSGGSSPAGTSEIGLVWPLRLNGSTTAWPASTVKSWPKARSKFERLSSSMTSQRPLLDGLDEQARAGR